MKAIMSQEEGHADDMKKLLETLGDVEQAARGACLMNVFRAVSGWKVKLRQGESQCHT
jgi:hypothetical protein